MKKSLLVVGSALLASMSYAQVSIDASKYPNATKLVSEIENVQRTGFEALPEGEVAQSGTRAKDRQELGLTRYPLQSNSSVSKRLLVDGAGNVMATWTQAQLDNFQTRGSGLNFAKNWCDFEFDGGNRKPLEADEQRVGFPSMTQLEDGRAVIAAHRDDPYGFVVSVNDGVGSNNWSFYEFETSTGSDDGKQGLWCRIAAGSNNTVHMISTLNTGSGTIEGGSGVADPMIYSSFRVTGSGIQTIEEGIELPGLDLDEIQTTVAEDYAIAADGDNVAIVVSGLADPVLLFKSEDNGATWNKTIVYDFPYKPQGTGGIPEGEELIVGDGMVDVVLDKNGNAHVAFRGSVFTGGADGATFSPGTFAMFYWNEVSTTISGFANQLTVDTDGDGNWSIGQGHFDNTIAYNGIDYLAAHPTIALDDDNPNHVYIFTAVTADADTNSAGQSYRDIHVIASTDGGETFNPSINLTCDEKGTEAVFPTPYQKVVNGHVHFTYQSDQTPGASTDFPDAHTIIFAKVAVEDILDGSADCNVLEGCESAAPVRNLNTVLNLDVFPNPANDVLTVNTTGLVSGTVELMDVAGKVVATQSINADANATFNVTSLEAGIYMVNIASEKGTSSTQVVVAH